MRRILLAICCWMCVVAVFSQASKVINQHGEHVDKYTLNVAVKDNATDSKKNGKFTFFINRDKLYAAAKLVVGGDSYVLTGITYHRSLDLGGRVFWFYDPRKGETDDYLVRIYYGNDFNILITMHDKSKNVDVSADCNDVDNCKSFIKWLDNRFKKMK